MHAENVRNYIDHAQEFCARLSKYYDGLSEVAEREKVKLLLKYLSTVEKRHEEALADYAESAPQDIVDTWFKCGADKATMDDFTPPQLTPDMSVDDVLQEALRLDRCLSELYQEAIDRAHTDRIKNVFQSLLESNDRDMHELARDCGHLQDW